MCSQQIIDLADQIHRHQFPILGTIVDAGRDIRWRRDYLRGIETGLVYFRRIPYLDTPRAGDHKVIWELNRHQHLIVLAQAYLLTGDARHLDEIQAQLESWIAANPFHRGTNWASALEVAFRALSWIWVDHLLAARCRLSSVRDGSICCIYMVATWRTISRSISRRTIIWSAKPWPCTRLGCSLRVIARAARWETIGCPGDAASRWICRSAPTDPASSNPPSIRSISSICFGCTRHLAAPGCWSISPSWSAWPSICTRLRDLRGLPPMLGDDDGGQFARTHRSKSSAGQGSGSPASFPKPAWR